MPVICAFTQRYTLPPISQAIMSKLYKVKRLRAHRTDENGVAWFQCEFEFACSAPNTIGSTCGPPPAHSDGPAVCQLREAGRARGGAAGASARCCAMSETMYSLFHRKRARSATWKEGKAR